MIVLSLGLPRSGSTWVFNVVRALLAGAGEDYISVYAETGAQFAERCPPGARNVLIKAHYVDEVLTRVLDAAGAASIVTWRDPRDVVASMAGRGLGEPLQLARSVSGTASALLGYRDGHPGALVLRYEDGFMEDVGSVRRIAEHLQLRPDDRLVEEIHQRLSYATLRDDLQRWSSDLGEDASFSTHVDLSTHWHKDHLGDARVGKWKDIAPPAVRDGVDSALGPLDAAFRDPLAPLALRWSRGLFEWGDRVSAKRGVATDEGPQILLGPAASLPAGRWKLSFTAQAGAGGFVELKIDLSVGDVRATVRHVADETPSSFWLEFEHAAPLAPLNVQVTREGPPAKGWVAIRDLRAERIGSGGAVAEAVAARPVTTAVTPG